MFGSWNGANTLERTRVSGERRIGRVPTSPDSAGVLVHSKVKCISVANMVYRIVREI